MITRERLDLLAKTGSSDVVSTYRVLSYPYACNVITT